MGVLNPWLLFGLAGVAVPIVIHLLNRFRHREVEWGAMELLRRAIVLRSRQIQIEDILLLILRCLAVALLALAIARPTITRRTGWLGGGSDAGVVVALDGSFSMERLQLPSGAIGDLDHTRAGGAGRRFADALARCREVLATVEPGTPVTLVEMGDRPRILLRNAGYEPQRVEKVLAEVAPLPERLNLERCLREVGTLTEELKTARRECYLVSDAQAASWGELSDAAGASLDKLAGDSSLFFLTVPAAGSENLAVTKFHLAGGRPLTGGLGRFVAEVANTGRSPRRDVPVSLELSGETVDRRVVEEIAPGATETVPLFARFTAPGPAHAIARIGRDALNVDNVRHAALDVRDTIRVLLVDGDPSDRPYAGETDYLARMLSPNAPASGGGRPGAIVPERVSWLELPGVRLDGFDVVVLANVADLRDRQAKNLLAFVRAGGGLLVTLGDKIEPKLLAARLGSEDVPLLPAVPVRRVRAPQVDGRPSPGWTIAAAGEHPLNYVVGLIPPPLLDEARVEELFETTPAGGGARVILKLAETGLPLLLGRPCGQGQVLLLTTSADRAWGNLAIHPLFPMLMHEAVGYLAGQGRRRSLLVGEPLTVSLPSEERTAGGPASAPAAGPGRQAVFRGPDGKGHPVQLIRRDGRLVAEFDQPTTPGIYEVFPPGGRGGATTLAVNVDPRESAVAALDRPALAGSLKGVDVRMPADAKALAEQIRQVRVGRELWRILLTAGLVVLAVEAALAWWFGRRIRTEPVDVSRSRATLNESEADQAVA